MQRDLAGSVTSIRAMAARMRAYAAQTSVALFRRRFEGTAADLEEAASDLESRADAPAAVPERNSKTEKGASGEAPFPR